MARPIAPDSLTGWLEQVVSAQPTATALRFGAESWSYGQLWAYSAELARWVRRLPDYSEGCRVGLVGANTPDYLAAYLGVIRAGAVVVPLNDRDSAADLTSQLELVEAIGCLLGEVPADLGAELAASHACWPVAAMTAQNGSRPLAPTAAAPAVILLTSGSTGRPKGVVHTHQSLLHAALQMTLALPFGRGDVSIAFLPFFASAPEQVFPALLTGGVLDILPRFSVEAVSDAAARATSFDGVPTIMARLLHDGERDKLAHLRWVSFASEPMPDSLLRQWWDAFPSIRTFQFYGMTELLTITQAPPELLAVDPRTVGVPYPTSEVQIVDEEMRALPTGSEGQVTCRSPARMAGYWNDPEATRQATTSEGAICTGDIGRLDDNGALHLVGRSKDLIISGGLKISPVEIEAVACSHPRIAAAAVVGVPDERWGETPVIVAVSTQGETVTPEEVLDHCRAQLGGYKRPSAAVVVPSLPVTGIGKLAKSELREAILGGDLTVVRAS